MEFKIIVYILIAIGWYVMKNYKKLADENRKRTFSKPVEYPPVNEIPIPKPVPATKPKKVYDKIETADAKVIRARKIKHESLRKPRPELITPDFDFFKSVFNEKESGEQVKSEENVKPHALSVFENGKVLRNAIVYGEIINQPRWAIY